VTVTRIFLIQASSAWGAERSADIETRGSAQREPRSVGSTTSIFDNNGTLSRPALGWDSTQADVQQVYVTLSAAISARATLTVSAVRRRP
jgi:hypothetical protein